MFHKFVFPRPYSSGAQMPDSQLCVQRRETYRQPGETVNNKPVLPLRGVWPAANYSCLKITIMQSVLFLTQGCLFYQINRSEFPVHVDGPSIRTLSNVTFGRSDLAGKYYSTTAQEQFSSKEVLRPKPLVYPPSHMLLEQGTFGLLTCIFTIISWNYLHTLRHINLGSVIWNNVFE